MAVRLLAFPLCCGWMGESSETDSFPRWMDRRMGDVDRRTIPIGVFLFPSLHIFMHIDMQAGRVVSWQRIILLGREEIRAPVATSQAYQVGHKLFCHNALAARGRMSYSPTPTFPAQVEIVIPGP